MNVCCYLSEVESSGNDNFTNSQPKISETAHKVTLNLLTKYLRKITNVVNMNCFGRGLTKKL